MGNFFKDNDDLRFYFERAIDWAPIVEVTEHRFRRDDGFKSVEEAVAFYRDVLEMVGAFVADEVAPHAAEIDRNGVILENGEVRFPEPLKTIFERIKGLGLHGLSLPRELSGMNAPLLVYFIMSELFARAEVSVMTHHGFHGGMAMAMLVFSIREGSSVIDGDQGIIRNTRFADAIREIVAGDAWGCMDITEPDAGSDMAQLRARGEQDEHGNWFVTGEKIFITSGHGKYHFVIARTENDASTDAFSGLDQLSMFLVPTYEEDENGNRRRIVQIARVEEKLGHHGSATCAMNFDRAPAFLIGKRGEGFQHMLTLMNNARIGVGFECIGLCEAAYRLARSYAEGRRSMGKTIDRHEMIADYLDEMDADVRGLRALAMYGAIHEEVARKLELVLDNYTGLSESERKEFQREKRKRLKRARRATPLLKYLAAEKAVEMSRRAIQIHGGNGYTTEYGAEKLLRDAIVMPIYEGTSQIQALMAMKDTLGGILKNPQAFVRRQAQARWRSVSVRDPLARQLARIQVLSAGAQQHLMMRTLGNKVKDLRGEPLTEWPDRLRNDWDPKRDFAFAMLHAERLTRILADEMIGEILWAQVQENPDRREILERYLERAEPRCRHLYEEITTTGARILEQLQRRDPSVGRAAPKPHRPSTAQSELHP